MYRRSRTDPSPKRLRTLRASLQARSIIALLLAAFSICVLASCAKGQDDNVAVRVGRHAISERTVQHWMSALIGKGSNLREPGPKVPVPPAYTACIADQRAHQRSMSASQPSTQKQLKAHCAFEYRRFKLKALYLLISYQWVTGEAAELGVKVDRNELRRQLATFEQALAPNKAAFQRDLRFWRASMSNILLSLELSQLTTRIEAKLQAAAGGTAQQGEAALARFGLAYKRKWQARTDCSSGYVVPICRQYRAPKTPSALVPPSVPLTGMPAGS